MSNCAPRSCDRASTPLMFLRPPSISLLWLKMGFLFQPHRFKNLCLLPGAPPVKVWWAAEHNKGEESGGPMTFYWVQGDARSSPDIGPANWLIHWMRDPDVCFYWVSADVGRCLDRRVEKLLQNTKIRGERRVLWYPACLRLSFQLRNGRAVIGLDKPISAQLGHLIGLLGLAKYRTGSDPSRTGSDWRVRTGLTRIQPESDNNFTLQKNSNFKVELLKKNLS